MSVRRIALPGQPIRLIKDPDPWAGLTQRQRHILDTVRSYNGNRSRAARHLGITVQSVQHAIRAASLVGLVLKPPGRGPDLTPRQRRGNNAKLTEADLFAARTIGVRDYD